MKNETRKQFLAYTARVADLNGVPNAAQNFTVEPSVQQRLEQKIQESSEFLGKINIVPVSEQSGQVLGLGVPNTIAGTTDTTTQERQATSLSGPDETNSYACAQINYDVSIPYSLLDAWAKFPDFQARMRDAVAKRAALDRMIVGFHGTSRAATSDRVAHPMLQDVGVGWLEKIRTKAPERFLSGGKTDQNKVKVGLAGDYANLDGLVFDALTLLEPWHRESPDLLVFCSRELLHDKYLPMVNVVQKPTETIATDVLMAQKRIGGLNAVSVPYFPNGTVLITTYSNLSIYYQDGARRRSIVEEPKRDRIADYNSSNDAFVIENYGAASLIQNIELIAAE